MTNLEMKSNNQTAMGENFLVMDHVISLFESLGSFLDRKFFEMQEFIYYFNKIVYISNKNFSQIGQVVPFRSPLDSLH